MYLKFLMIFTCRKEDASMMNEPFEYKGVFAPYMKGYVQMKESCGFKILNTKWFLKEFDEYTIKIGLSKPDLTRELIEAWVETRKNDCNRTICGKYSHLAQLARYMNEHGLKAYIVPIPKCTNSRGFIPYIFTDAQMKAIFRESDNLLRESHRIDDPIISIPCLIRLLYSTGLRITEAVSLRNEDVDLELNVIKVGVCQNTKNNEERYVPICQSLRKVLIHYLAYRNRLKIKGLENPEHLFFVKLDGTGVSSANAYRWFRKVYERCGIQYLGDRFGPRVHDLRHSMATNSLSKMIKSGLDVYAALPLLSACIGHKSLASTEGYVRLTCEYYPELLKQCASLNEFVYPQHDETD